MFSKSDKPSSKIETVVGSETDIEGNLQTHQSIRIDGKIKGEIRAESVVLGESGVVLGDITADRVTVGGKVKGNISATTLLELLPEGQIIGDISTNKLVIADGAHFEGNCHMMKSDGQILELKPQNGNHVHEEGQKLKVIAANGKH